MPIKNIITVPNEILRKKSQLVEKITNLEKTLVNDMFETMYNSNGIGLAAIQIGIAKRIVVLDVSGKDEEKKPMCFINPKIKNTSDERSVYEEGCLSIPNTFIQIERPKTCVVEYVDLNSKKKEIKCNDLLSTCIQHECNHLDGKLIIDFLSKFKKDLIIKKISKNKSSPNKIVV
tara:strand:- start:1006 stop:1530 length:525 start_codon:yes stop_codon:yes gene_type:complete